MTAEPDIAKQCDERLQVGRLLVTGRHGHKHFAAVRRRDGHAGRNIRVARKAGEELGYDKALKISLVDVEVGVDSVSLIGQAQNEVGQFDGAGLGFLATGL